MHAEFQSLEPRRLLAGATLSSTGLLDIVGTRRADKITVARDGRGRVAVRINKNRVVAFAAAEVESIRVNGGRGNDRLHVSPALSATLNGGKGHDTLVSFGGDDHLDGGTGNDFLNAGPGNDRLAGGVGNDVLMGNLGDDVLGGGGGDDFMDGGDGADAVTGNEGRDTVDYSSRRAPLSITQDDRANDGHANERDNVAWDVEVIRGGSAHDLIRGSDRLLDNLFIGGDGWDTLDGGDGEDTLDGGDGNDRLIAGREDLNLMTPEPDPAPDHSKVNPNVLMGGAGNDTLVPGLFDDLLSGGAGEDTVDYSDYGAMTGLTITLDGVRNDGFNEFVLDLPNGNVARRHTEADNVGADVEHVIGSRNGDRIVGSAGANRLDGGGWHDTIIGGGGNDFLIGGEDDDSLEGGAGNDTLWGGWFDDREEGNLGVDRLLGGDGNDRLDAVDDVFGDDPRFPPDLVDGGAGTDVGRIDGVDTRSNVESLEAP